MDDARDAVAVSSGLHHLFWAKSSDSGGHPLIQHMLDVAAVARGLIETQSPAAMDRLSVAWNLDHEQTKAWAAALCGLHDLGKATPGFQSKWVPGRDRVARHGFLFPKGAPERHDASTRHFLPDALVKQRVSRTTANRLADAVAAHHGFHIQPSEQQAVALFALPSPWPESIQALAEEYLGAVVAGLPTPRLGADLAHRAAAMQWLAGLCATADWIGSSASDFPHWRPWTDAAAFFAESRAMARHHLAFSPARTSVARSGLLDLALGPGRSPRPLQQTLVETLAAAPAAPALLVIEAPMGEGKSEAAFAFDAWATRSHQARGTYFAMPTQATSNALFGRVAGFLARAYGGSEPLELQLAHGSASRDDTQWRLKDIGFGPDDASVSVSAWFAGHRRTLLAANAVGTVDQAIVGVLNARHAFVRLFGLSDRVVVLDEVHAYDAYTGGLIERLVAWLRELGCSVVVMSATLPSERRDALVRAFAPDTSPAPAAPYPRITLVQSRQGCLTRSFAASRHQKVSLCPLPAAVEGIAETAAGAAAQGMAVLVVANTVARAQAIYRQLSREAPMRAMLFHARFPMDDRLAIEASLLSRFGPEGTDREGWIVVATQVVEQSLDVDFDLLISDVAPVDLLLQRMGRLHRHKRARPSAATQAVTMVGGLTSDGSADVQAYHPVYAHLPVLRTTAALVPHVRGLPVQLPDDIDALVQHVYGDEPPRCTDDAFARLHEAALLEWRTDMARMSELAAQAALPQPPDWPAGLPPSRMDDEEATQGLARFGTRLGEESVSVIPVFQCDDEFRIWPETPGWPQAAAVPRNLAKQLGQRHMRVSHRRLVPSLRAATLPLGWEAQPALVGHRPLLLDTEGYAEVAGIAIRLDSEYGLVIGAKARAIDAAITQSGDTTPDD
jgi:CRISPR-associated endonuclease/helicase Cas3